MLMCATSLLGCNLGSKRAVLVTGNDLFKIGPGVSGKAYLWNDKTKQWELSSNEVQYPEGWIVTSGKHEPSAPAKSSWWLKMLQGK